MDVKLAVVILAAGKSTRFKSEKTKVLHELCGKPMIEWVLDATLVLGPSQVLVVYGTHSERLRRYFTNGYPAYYSSGSRYKLDFVLQDPPQGTAHALLQCTPYLNDGITHLLVMPGDAPLVTSKQLSHLVSSALQEDTEHAVLTAEAAVPGDLGRVVRAVDKPQLVERIVEAHEAAEAELAIREINTGIYFFSRNVFAHLEQAADQLGASEKKGEYYLPDVVRIAPTRGVFEPSFSMPIGVNDRAQLYEAETVLLDRIRRRWMDEGVTFRLPDTTYIHGNVKLAPDVEIGPHCVLTRGTRIARNTKLVQGCLLEHCIVGENCELRHVRALESVIEDNVQAGPYVNMRPGTVIHSGVKIGNFVETKNAEVGQGSKLPHLQYIGDATLGEGCNIGAGTIFCNYDGVQKKHTTLGKTVFIGSNATLQGGITLGDNAYVAMGSSITKDVPKGALAIGRARQENKLGYVEKLMDRLMRRKQKAQDEKQEDAGG